MKETRSNDGDKTTSAWQHKIMLGVDVQGNPHAYFGKDIFEWPDAKRYVWIVRNALNDLYKRVTNGWNCPLHDDDPIDPEMATEGVGGLLLDILIGTEQVTTPGEQPRDVVRMYVPDGTQHMKGLADHVEKLIHVMDGVKASRRFR